MAWSKVEKVTALLAATTKTHEYMLRQYNKLDASGEAARQPLVLALHKACAGTGVDVFDLIQKLNEHNK